MGLRGLISLFPGNTWPSLPVQPLGARCTAPASWSSSTGRLDAIIERPLLLNSVIEHLLLCDSAIFTMPETLMTTLPVTYGYARVSKADDDSKNLETQLRILAEHGIRDHLVFTDVVSGRSLQRPRVGRPCWRYCGLGTRWWWPSWTGSAGTSRRG